ncbi:MAG: PH domain-containing protein [Clostridiales bacterium]|nr:PH domain-containing protein [Clostridiales bacterium]
MDYPLLKNHLPQAIKNVWRKTNILRFLIMLVIGLVVGGLLFFNDVLEGILLYMVVGYFALTLLVLLISMAIVPIRYRYFRYEITDEDIIFQKGFFFRSITYVPISKVQHIETEQGPFLRRDKLMELVVHTAATTHKIAGLSVEETLHLRDQIIEKMKEAKEDV